MLGLNEFEQAVFAKLVAGEHPVLVALREQSEHTRVKSRHGTGVGFFCDFEVIGGGISKLQGNFHIGDVNASVSGLAHGAGLVLFVREGQLSVLEGYTYGEPWPDSVREFSLAYSEPERKSQLAKLDAHLSSFA